MGHLHQNENVAAIILAAPLFFGGAALGKRLSNWSGFALVRNVTSNSGVLQVLFILLVAVVSGILVVAITRLTALSDLAVLWMFILAFVCSGVIGKQQRRLADFRPITANALRSGEADASDNFVRNGMSMVGLALSFASVWRILLCIVIAQFAGALLFLMCVTHINISSAFYYVITAIQPGGSEPSGRGIFTEMWSGGCMATPIGLALGYLWHLTAGAIEAAKSRPAITVLCVCSFYLFAAAFIQYFATRHIH